MPVFIAGAGLAKVGRHYHLGVVELVDQALRDAERRGGLPLEPEAIVVASGFSGVLEDQLNVADVIATWLGYVPRAAYRVEAGSGSGGSALALAYSLVASGVYRSVLLVGVEKLADHPSWVLAWADTLEMDSRVEGYYGMRVAAAYALMARVYMGMYGVTRRELSAWPVLMHSNARSNPYAALRNPIRPEDVEKSPVLAEPLHVFDGGPASDGAAVVLLASSEAFKGDVRIESVASATDYTSLGLRPSLDELRAVREAATRAYKLAGISARDVDVVELHDHYSITGVLALEALGFAEKGYAAKMLTEGHFAPGDKPTVNPSGGAKARGEVGGATGVYQVAEAYLQLTGEFPGVKVPGAETALVVDIGGPASNATVAVLRKT